MSFLTKAAERNDRTDGSAELEEQYERLYVKMGRDFVHKNDLVNILNQILELVDPLRLSQIDLSDDSEARKRALEYKTFIEDQRDGSKVYNDLIDLDD